MQAVSTELLAVLRNGVNNDPSAPLYDFTDCYEFYASSYLPDASTGFDPADASEKFAAIELTWNGSAYRREVVSRGSIDRHMGQQTNSVQINFSNVDGYLATWAQTEQIEGMWLVIRCVSRSITNSSIILFAGKAGKPSTINNKSFSISATQDFLSTTAELPLRTFSTDDPLGRDPSDPLFEGIRFVSIDGSFTLPVIGPAANAVARFFGQRDTTIATRQWSSHEGSIIGQVIPEILGRAQIQLLPMIYADRGAHVGYVMAAGSGPIKALLELKSRTKGWGDPLNSFTTPPAPADIHLGDAGGTGTNATPNVQFPTMGLLSHLAHIAGASIPNPATNEAINAALAAEEGPPVITSLAIGRIIPVPNSSGVYDDEDWTDNPVHLARWIFLATGTPAGLMGDAVNYLTSLFCDEPLLDESNGERVFIQSPDIAQAGTAIRRFTSTGRINSRMVRYRILTDDISNPPYYLEPDEYEPLVLSDIPNTFTIQRVYRVRYAFNAPIVEKVKASDFLYKTLYPSFRGYHTISGKGQVEIKSEKAEDNCILRSSTSIGATSVPVDDVTPWKTGDSPLWGKLYIGFGLTSSENRRVSSAVYTTDANAITLTTSASGISSTASGATLSGGSTTVQASGTVTLSGTAGAGASVTVTINGIAVTYILDQYATLASSAVMLAMMINADGQLKRFISATYSGAVLTIKAKWGVLNLAGPALAFAHTGPRANPTVTPTLAASSGTMAAGDYKVAYAYVTGIGRTLISPIGTITLSANQKIDISTVSLPVGVTAINWYVSESPNSDKLLYYTQNNGAGFSATSLPSKNNPSVPPHNNTGEECLRVALSFASNSQGATVLAQSGLTRGNMNDYNFPLGSEQSSINQIKGKYRNAANDFALTEIRVNDYDHQALVGKVNPLEIDLSGVDNHHQAFRLMNGLLSKYREGDWFHTFSTSTGEALLLEEGDLETASDSSGGHVNQCCRIESLSIGPDWKVTIRRSRRYSTLMFSDDVRQHVIPLPTTLRYVQTLATNFIPLDIPIYRETDEAFGFGIYIPMAPENGDGDWKGARIYSDASGEYVSVTPKQDVKSMIGETVDTLAATSNTTSFDTGYSLRVTINTRGLKGPQDSTDDKVQAGANLAAIGAHGRWELVRFVHATPVVGMENTYDLDRFLRGVNGTEDNLSNHGDGDQFILLTDEDGQDLGVQYLPLDVSLLNETFNLKAVTVNEDVADAVPQSFTWEGLSLKPRKVTNLVVIKDGVGDYFIQFRGRPRPSEEPEQYAVEVWTVDGSTLKTTMEVIPTRGVAAAFFDMGSGFNYGDLYDPTGKPPLADTTPYADENDLMAPTSPASTAYIKSIPAIEQTGVKIDVTTDVPRNAGNIEIPDGVFSNIFGLIGADVTGTPPANSSIPFQIQYYSSSAPGDPQDKSIEVYNYEDLIHSEYSHGMGSPANVRAGESFTIILSGNECRFYRNYREDGKPLAVVAFPSSIFPLRIFAGASGGSDMVNFMVKGISPATIYSRRQQLAPAPEGFGSLQDPIRIKVYQRSKYGNLKGVITDYTTP